MKILMVNKFHYRRGGSETYFFSLAQALVQKGNEVIYFSLKDKKNEFCAQSKYFVDSIDYNAKTSKLQQLKLGLKSIYSFESKSKFEQLIKDEKPDIVHINLVHRQITLSIADVCKKNEIPVVYTAHDLVGPCLVGSLLTPQREICRKCYNGKFVNCIKHKCIKNSFSKSVIAYFEAQVNKFNNSYNKIDAYIAPSEFVKNEIEKSNITKSTVYKMTNFLPTETEYTVVGCGKEKYFLFLGSLSKDKGVFTLVKAFHKSNLPCKLILAGKGEEEKKIKDYIKKNFLEEKIILTGFITGNDLRDLTENSYTVVLPSECCENCPYALMEPMSKGKPVIGADIGGIPEMVIENETGWKFQPGNIDNLSNVLVDTFNLNENDYLRISKGACDFARKTFSVDKYVEDLTCLYEELLEEKQSENI